MKRKVIKQGNDTLTLTLPRKWTAKYNIKAGDELELEEQDKALVIGSHADKREKSITVDVTGLDRTTVLILIQGAYRFGYDAIEITTEESNVMHHRVGKEVNLTPVIYDFTNRLVGVEVISASPKRFLIKRIADESIDDFPTVFRRIFLLMNEMMDNFTLACKNNDIEMQKTIEFQHANIKKFINFCMRLLNKYGHKESKKTELYFNIISLLSKAEDIVKNNSRQIAKHNLKLKSKQFFELIDDVRKSIRLYYELHYDYNLSKVAELNKQRDHFRNKMFKYCKDLSKEENLIIGGMAQIVEILLDVTETRMAMEE